MITIDSKIFKRSPNFKLGLLLIEQLTIINSNEKLKELLITQAEETKKIFSPENLYKDEFIQSMRQLYKSWKIDPSRYRPSAERLIRRILKSKQLYFINSAVDVSNFISIKYRLPTCVYDKNRLSGNLKLSIGNKNDTYPGLTGIEISTEGKAALYDEAGPIGSATTDSQRTKVDTGTPSVVFLVYVPENVGREYVKDLMLDYYETLKTFSGGKIIYSDIIYKENL